MPAIDLEQFVASLYQSGILPAREIQSFFDEIPEDRCPTTSEELAAEMVRSRIVTPFQAEALLQGRSQGLVLGSYVVLDPLGKGGMGGVFRGMHRGMKRIVALKVLPRRMKSPESVERFQREVEAMARLSHPNIVAAFDAGEQNGLRFLAMEYIEGKDLESLVAERGVLPIATAVEYLLQAAQGLQYAHWHGMVHRDVKPANLMLDWQGTIKILDLGIVGLVPGISEAGPGSESGGNLQRAGLGTPDYIAPEQAADRTAVGPQCDVYSLGCTLHFLLAGRPVFPGDTTEAKLLAHRHAPVPSICAARPDAPESLDRLFQRMLAKRPEDRPATMADVMAELAGCLQAIAGQPQRGLLVIRVREPDLAIQVADQGGDVVMDCPAAEGILQVAIPPGRYRLIVRKGGRECHAEEFEMGDSGRKVLEVPRTLPA